MLGGAVGLVRDGEVEKCIEVTLALCGSDCVRSPTRRDRSDTDVVSTRATISTGDCVTVCARNRAMRETIGSPASPQRRSSSSAASPLSRSASQCSGSSQAPSARNSAEASVSEGSFQSTQTGPRQAHLGHFEKAGERHLHGHAALARRARDGLHMVIGRARHRDIAVSDGTGFVRLRVVHREPRLDKIRDGPGQCVGLFSRPCEDDGPQASATALDLEREPPAGVASPCRGHGRATQWSRRAGALSAGGNSMTDAR